MQETDRRTKMALNLPQDIVAAVFRRLSVADLLRCRSVAKQWCSLIDGPEFVKTHLDHALKTASDVGVVMIRNDHGELYSMNLDCPTVAKELNCPIVGGYIRLLGSCNGLLVFRHMEDLVIWNPSTRRYRKLPIPPIEFAPGTPYRDLRRVSHGFGYDHVGDDYKLLTVVIIYNDGDSFDSYAKVYSAKTNSWKRICFPYFLVYSNNGYGVFTNNALHWIVSRNRISWNEMFIVAIDLEKEVCLEVPMPSFEDQLRDAIYLEVLGGSLCAVRNFHYGDPICKWKRVDVWMMKEYGVKESWSKLFSVVPTEQICPSYYIRPVTYLRAFGNNRILLDLDGKQFITHDIAEERVGGAVFYNSSCRLESIACVGSLVGLNELEGHSGWEKVVERQSEEEVKIQSEAEEEEA